MRNKLSDFKKPKHTVKDSLYYYSHPDIGFCDMVFFNNIASRFFSAAVKIDYKYNFIREVKWLTQFHRQAFYSSCNDRICDYDRHM